MNKARIFEPLIGKTITQIERLAVVEEDEKNNLVVLSDTLIFNLSNSNCWEILVNSEETILKKITNKQDFILSFALEDGETINRQPIFEKIEVPFTIDSILETWAGIEDPLLVAVNFLAQNKQPLISIPKKQMKLIF